MPNGRFLLMLKLAYQSNVRLRGISAFVTGEGVTDDGVWQLERQSPQAGSLYRSEEKRDQRFC